LSGRRRLKVTLACFAIVGVMLFLLSLIFGSCAYTLRGLWIQPNKALQLTPSRLALSITTVFPFHSPAIWVVRRIGAAELGVRLLKLPSPYVSFHFGRLLRSFDNMSGAIALDLISSKKLDIHNLFGFMCFTVYSSIKW
jgi:hypothetical protein